MATTHIHAITQTINASLNYITSDKIELMLKDDIADSIAYAMNDKTGEVTYFTLTSTLNCKSLENPTDDFHALMYRFGKNEIENGNAKTKDGKPILGWHLIQSFDQESDRDIDPRMANEIGVKLAKELFPNHPVVVSTHTNTEHIHNHIEFCAWSRDGRKWNQCNENYQRIRECSDRLCGEYGLSVLEHTREQKLIRWVDADGVTHYFEPTARKIEMIRQREAGEISRDDVGSYRNTISYQEATAKKQTNIEIIKQAIDSKLPYATSYEHLLMMLREMGFKVKDKKKNGDWLAHVSFEAPTAGRAVRDYSIGEENYYTRENLTKVIDELNAERRRSETLQGKLNLPYYEEYEYGTIDVQAINEDYRAERVAGGAKIVQRGEVERSIIRDVKKSDIELYGLYDTTRLHKLIAEQREAQKKRRPAQKREEVLVRQIQESFDNLRFIEKKQIYSYAQINEIVSGLWSQYNACLFKISEAESMIARLEDAANAPVLLTEIKSRMELGKNDPAYMMEQYHQDVKLLNACIESIKKYNVADASSLQSLQDNIAKYKEQIGRLQGSLSVFANELASYNRCVATLARIDRDSGRDNSALLEAYQAAMNRGQQEAEKTEKEREKKKEKGFVR